VDLVTKDTLPSRLIGAEQRIPESMEEFHGPDSGRVALPTRLAWSGLTEYDVTDLRQRLTLSRVLLDCGQREDVTRYLNATLLVHDWPYLRRMMDNGLMATWERRLPALRERYLDERG
jgi:hypothetical protein